MYRTSFDSEGSFVQRLRHRWMRVHSRNDVFCSGFEPDSKTELVNQFRRIFANNVSSKDFSIRLACHNFDEAFCRTSGDGLAERCGCRGNFDYLTPNLIRC